MMRLPLSVSDLRYAVRILTRNAAFTTIAIVSLAIGIGANTAIFTVVNAVILRPLPFTDPEQLVTVQERLPRLSREPIGVSAPDFVELQRENQSLSAIAAFQNVELDLGGDEGTVRIVAARAVPDLFPLLGARPLLGRTFTADEDRQHAQVAVLGHAMWQARFGGRADAIGQVLTLDRKPYTIVGVMPRAFVFPTEGLLDSHAAALWVPMSFSAAELRDVGNNYTLSVVGRLKPGVALSQAERELNAIADRIWERLYGGADDEKLSTHVARLQDQVVSKVRTLLLILLGAIGLVLLVACANIANLLMARATNAQRELAIRTALGASRLQLFARFIAESVLLALAGGVAGLLVASWGARALIRLSPTAIPRALDIGVDLPVLLFAFGLSLITALFFGTVSFVVSVNANVNETLKASTRSLGSTAATRRLRQALVVAEVALALVLLTSAGLLIRSFMRLKAIDPGFESRPVVTMSVDLPKTIYDRPAQIKAFHTELWQRLRQVPGVRAVAGATVLPMTSNNDRVFTPEGYQGGEGAAWPRCNTTWTIGNYFQVLGIPLVKGRLLTEADSETAALVAVVSQRIAERYWPGQDPIGKRLKYGPPQFERPWLTIVGVVADVKQGPLDRETLPAIYHPYAQAEDYRLLGLGRSVSFALRADSSAAALAGVLRKTVWSLDSQLAVTNVRGMSEAVDRSIAPRRFNMLLLALFAGIALMLASIGVYGVLSYFVAQRRRELGVRIALGASRLDIFGLVIRQGMGLTAIGLAIGLLATIATGRLLGSLLYDVSPADPLTLGVVTLCMAVVAFVASCVPAMRAIAVDPVVALRSE